MQIVVRSSLNESEGTVVKEVVKKMERMLISGVALDKDADRISVIGIKDVPGSAFKLFNTLAKQNINVDIIIQSVGREGTKDISFTNIAYYSTHIMIFLFRVQIYTFKMTQR